MTIVSEKIKKHVHEVDAGLGAAYGLFSKVLERKKLKIGVEIGVAFGGHAESILKTSTVDRLYGIDPYVHIDGYDDPMNLTQEEFDQVCSFTLERLARYGNRYQHIRKMSEDAVKDIHEVDFVYIDVDHSYKGVWNDLCIWYSKVRVGGVIGGHDYNHPNFPGVKQAVDEFFVKRFGWEIHVEGEGVWWVEKQPLNVSFIMPAHNCEKTIQESVESIMKGNFIEGDELVIVNDGSTDNTENVLNSLKLKYPILKLFRHARNKGGATARNTAVENTKNQIIFCLDSDNILINGSVQKLKVFLEKSGADVASFESPYYFIDNKESVTHKWTYKNGTITLADYLSGPIVPGASGNYIFTKESWICAGGYPVFSSALDTWGFGFQQLATGSKMVVMPESYYYHRYGHESYWVRESKKGKISMTATKILIPFIDLINDIDVDYIMSRRGRNSWFTDLKKHPIRLKSGDSGSSGITTSKTQTVFQKIITNTKYLISRVIPNTIKEIIRGDK